MGLRPLFREERRCASLNASHAWLLLGHISAKRAICKRMGWNDPFHRAVALACAYSWQGHGETPYETLCRQLAIHIRKFRTRRCITLALRHRAMSRCLAAIATDTRSLTAPPLPPPTRLSAIQQQRIGYAAQGLSLNFGAVPGMVRAAVLEQILLYAVSGEVAALESEGSGGRPSSAYSRSQHSARHGGLGGDYSVTVTRRAENVHPPAQDLVVSPLRRRLMGIPHPPSASSQRGDDSDNEEMSPRGTRGRRAWQAIPAHQAQEEYPVQDPISDSPYDYARTTPATNRPIARLPTPPQPVDRLRQTLRQQKESRLRESRKVARGVLRQRQERERTADMRRRGRSERESLNALLK
ncbi:hypothetical protein KIPB_000950 [Kipferlia bialata]|uniref:Uncharacterized protein n=1 Tax=Kipferlia bialata TaxID=797122 RepID=A0A9K3CN74_9EUKA|nr:hypothetical protein KIPB_000950 [Kipferlia bialata]|eukprot:g950.t1